MKRDAICDRMKAYENISRTYQRRQWEIDREIPVFTQDRNFVEKFL